MNESTLGKRISYHRKHLSLTQEQLAERVGVSAQAVSKWENDLSCPDINLLPQLADIFGITVDELLGKEAPHAAKPAEPIKNEVKHGRAEFHMEWKPLEGIWFAIYILCIGGLLLLTALRPELDVSWWTVLWTTALFIGGLAGVIHKPSFFPLAVTLAGMYFLITEFGIWKVSFGWSVVIPAFLLLWGVSLLIDVLRGDRRKHRRIEASGGVSKCDCTDGWLNWEMCFGQDTCTVTTPLLRGGRIKTRYGDFCVDFSGCQAVAPDCLITLEHSFGDLELHVPQRFELHIDRQNGAFAGDIEFSGEPSQAPEGVITLNPSVSFGDLRIRYV